MLDPPEACTFVRLSGVMAVKPARVWTKLPRMEGGAKGAFFRI